jgi:DNA-binding PadR family transcriptional regulator
MAKRRKVSNPLALAVLALLFERPMHPYEMASTLRDRNKEESIKLRYGSLYTVIDLLQRAGFIAPRETERAGRRPERTVYALTEAGSAELHDWMRDLVGTPVNDYPQFEAALAVLPVLPPEEAAALLDERAERLATEIRDTNDLMARAHADGVERLFLVEGEYRVAMRAAERRWVEALAREIRDEESWPVVREWRRWHTEGVRPSPSGSGKEDP